MGDERFQCNKRRERERGCVGIRNVPFVPTKTVQRQLSLVRSVE